MLQGKVKWFNTTKGFGFIEPSNGGSDIFVHISALHASGIERLNDNDQVEFELEEKNGKTSAVNIKVIAA